MKAFTITCSNCGGKDVKLHIYTYGVCFDCQNCEFNSVISLQKEELPEDKDKMIRSILDKQRERND